MRDLALLQLKKRKWWRIASIFSTFPSKTILIRNSLFPDLLDTPVLVLVVSFKFEYSSFVFFSYLILQLIHFYYVSIINFYFFFFPFRLKYVTLGWYFCYLLYKIKVLKYSLSPYFIHHYFRSPRANRTMAYLSIITLWISINTFFSVCFNMFYGIP